MSRVGRRGRTGVVDELVSMRITKSVARSTSLRHSTVVTVCNTSDHFIIVAMNDGSDPFQYSTLTSIYIHDHYFIEKRPRVHKIGSIWLQSESLQVKYEMSNCFPSWQIHYLILANADMRHLSKTFTQRV